jgi:hypothetical protein
MIPDRLGKSPRAAASPGSVVSIFYDADEPIAVGDALQTKTGRTYIIVTGRQQARGRHVGRWHLRCAVAEGPPPAGVIVHRLVWYPRT